MTNSIDRTDTDALLDFFKGNYAVVLREREGEMAPLLLKPHGLEVTDLEKFLDEPRRVKEHLKLGSVDSFVRYFNAYKDQSSVIFATATRKKPGGIEPPRLCGFLRYHEKDRSEEVEKEAEPGDCVIVGDRPRWLDWLIEYHFDFTEQAKEWFDNDQIWFDQESWLHFLEERATDVSEPTPAHMLNVARHFEAKKDTNFTSARRLEDGSVNFQFEETINAQAKTRTEKLEIPEAFTITLELWPGSWATFDCNFRFRIHAGTLKFAYRMIAVEKAITRVFNETLEEVRNKTDLEPYLKSNW